VCEYLEELHSICLPLYSNCTAGRAAVAGMWVRQAVAETELYGAPGELLACPAAAASLELGELAAAGEMVKAAYWRQDSRNCRYLLHYHSTPLPLPLYNHNLDKIMRCDSKCDPEGSLPRPFPLFPEEKAHINQRMNHTIFEYNQCLTNVGMITNMSLRANLTESTWSRSGEVKWSTCASLKTFVQNCTAALLTCLEGDNAEVVLAQDFSRMVHLVMEGLEGNAKREEVFGDFDHTHCDVFGGDISEGLRVSVGGSLRRLMVIYTLILLYWKAN
jgi:hypothetical protein